MSKYTIEVKEDTGLGWFGWLVFIAIIFFALSK